MVPLVDLVFKGSRVRLRRYSIALILMSVLVLATFMLISLVPSGTEKRPLNEPKQRRAHPKFQPLIGKDEKQDAQHVDIKEVDNNNDAVGPAPANEEENKISNNHPIR